MIGIKSCNHPYARIVFIAVEHFLTKREKGLRRHVIVFKNNTFIADRNCPFLRNVLGRVAAKVLLLVKTVNLTLPIDILIAGYLAARLNANAIAFAAHSVLIKEKTRRSCLLNLIEYLLEGFGAVKKK